jgi:polar amino acid transport system substrate-binding protein
MPVRSTAPECGAELVRAAGGIDSVIEVLRDGKADLFGTITDTVLAVAARLPGAKPVPGVFNSVGFAVAMPKGRSSAAQAKLTEIVNDAKAAGLVQQAIDRSGLKGVRVARE